MKRCQLEQLQKLLPVVPGIQDRKERSCSAIMVLLVLMDGEYHFIFEKRSSQVRQGGEVCFPGGEIDPQIDGDSEQAAIRETVEELGISKEKLTIIGKLDTLVAPQGIIIEAFLGIADITGLEEIMVEPREVDYVFTVPVSYFEEHEPDEYHTVVRVHPSYVDEDGKEIVLFPAKELGLPEIYTRPWGGRLHKILVYNVRNETIWGITARFIYDVVNKLKQLPNAD